MKPKTPKYSAEDIVDCGIDSIRFVMPKATLNGFLKKIELLGKLRLISRNKTVKDYAEYKFKGANKPLFDADEKHPFKIRYVSFKRGTKSLSNTMLVVENSSELNDLCKKRKKPFGYYVCVVFAGLFQPSRDIFKETYRILGKFLRRFKPYSWDVAVDFKDRGDVNSKAKGKFKESVKECADDVISFKTSIYANHGLKSGKFYAVDKICFYDKFEKQTNYHKQKIDEKFKDWKRLDVTFRLKGKFMDFIENENFKECVEVMDEIADKLTGEFPFGVYLGKFNEQIAYFKDMRKRLNLSKTIF